MATDATFDNQLQALATATANFANGKDADIKNTIITALGGSVYVDSTNFSGTAPTVTNITGGKRLSFGENSYIDVTVG